MSKGEDVQYAIDDTRQIYYRYEDLFAVINNEVARYITASRPAADLVDINRKPISPNALDKVVVADYYMNQLTNRDRTVAYRLMENLDIASRCIDSICTVSFRMDIGDKPRLVTEDGDPPKKHSIGVLDSGLQPSVDNAICLGWSLFPAFEAMATANDDFVRYGVSLKPQPEVGSRSMVIDWGILRTIEI